MWSQLSEKFKDRIIWPFSPTYTEVREVDSDDASGFTYKQAPIKATSSRVKIALALLILAITFGAGLLVASIGPRAVSQIPISSHKDDHIAACPLLSPMATPPKVEHKCGSTYASALASGCTFDLLSYSWVPKSCYDSETDLEFREWIANPNRTGGAFPFFANKSLSPSSHILDVDALSSMSGNIWVWSPEEEHVGHCIFWSRRIHRFLQGRFKWSESVAKMAHTSHCAFEVLDRLLSKTPLRRIEYGIARFKVQYDSCA
ncbi:hypothetical protein BDV96DRAFT_600791 [Lophiotrema nucula]|uniref:Uncharacterized protein n=1 Tax=Lophiotrema nucula TaxID=690887 RepID=A0A6A5Z6R3_9PLEO|nr:hypothetical protein BDV96DRAFT_600791 [Lophiotrema nucula]